MASLNTSNDADVADTSSSSSGGGGFLDRISNDDDSSIAAASTTTALTMDQVVEHIGFGRFHWNLVFLCGVGYFAEITELVVVSFVAPSIQRQMDLTNLQYGALGSSSFVGMAVGAFFWGFVSDHYGRQLSFALTVWLTFFGGFFSALAPNYTILLFLRFTAAFGIGGMLPVDYTVFLEFLPQENRGSHIVLVDAIGVVPALTLSALISWYFSSSEHVQWRWVLLISSIPVGIMAVLRRHVPESPRYHLAAGETEAAQRVVQSVADTNSVRLPDDWRLLSYQESILTENAYEDDDGEKQGSYAVVPNPECEFAGIPPQANTPESPRSPMSARSYHNNEDVDELMQNTRTTSATGHPIGELIQDPLRPTTLRLWLNYFLVQFSSAGMVFALPMLFDEYFVGKSEHDIALDLLIGVVGLIPGLAIAYVAVERSRTKTLAAFLMGAGVSVLCLGGAFLRLHNHAWALFVSIVLRGAMEGCFAILNTTAVESYPTVLRATGLGTAQIFDHIAGSLSPLVFSALNGNESTRPWVFYVYAVSYMLATIPALGLKDHAGVAVD